jgi:hypothetical protein
MKEAKTNGSDFGCAIVCVIFIIGLFCIFGIDIIQGLVGSNLNFEEKIRLFFIIIGVLIIIIGCLYLNKLLKDYPYQGNKHGVSNKS